MNAPRFRTVVAASVALVFLLPAHALAHAERDAAFPSGEGSVPQYRTSGPSLVVCKPDSTERIEALPAAIRARNEQLLAQCRFEHIQAAVDAVEEPGTRILVLPGVYREEPSRAPQTGACGELQRDAILTYDQQRSCPHVQNLIGIFGDATPDDDDARCDNALCDLQIEGTGASPEDVIVEGGFADDGEWAILNGIRADRADGLYLYNFTAQLFEFNAVYVMEADGFVIDRVLGRWNDEYAFLTFAVDHGLYTDCEAYGNGDSGIYPGSASDLPESHERYTVEIRRCRSHHNTLGYSGTAGNSVWAHDNDFYLNTVGVAMDSLFPNHPGLPQDSALFENNRIYANNMDYYAYLRDGTCGKPPAERGYEKGVVCPVVPLPVGSGLVLAGGNQNIYRTNDVWDNWRYGFMQFSVPAFLREEVQPDQTDTSHFNQYRNNRLGASPTGLLQPQTEDFWWDEQGEGNCWDGNESATGTVTYEGVTPLPDCENPSGPERRLLWNLVKSAEIAPCAQYDRSSNPEPEGCPWLSRPPAPEAREGAQPAAYDTLARGTSSRIGGADRYETAAMLAAEAFPEGADTVVLARGDDYPDALAGSYLAGRLNAPILLATPTAIPAATRDALEQLQPDTVVLLGGPAALGEEVRTELEAGGLEVQRLGGASRYETARLIATAGGAVGSAFTPGRQLRRTAILATGENFADALAAGPLAYIRNLPIILTGSEELSADARMALQDASLEIQQVVIAGGPAAVSSVVEGELRVLGLSVIRVGGRDRTETATMLADLTDVEVGWTSEQVHLAVGDEFADALAVAPLAGQRRSVLVLARPQVSTSALGSFAEAFLQRRCSQVAEVVLAGGPAALSPEVEQAATSAAICS